MYRHFRLHRLPSCSALAVTPRAQDRSCVRIRPPLGTLLLTGPATRTRERESSGGSGTETGSFGSGPLSRNRNRERRTPATARQKGRFGPPPRHGNGGDSTARSVNDKAPVTFDEGLELRIHNPGEPILAREAWISSSNRRLTRDDRWLDAEFARGEPPEPRSAEGRILNGTQ